MTAADAMSVVRQAYVNSGRVMWYERQTAQWDGFNGVFITFPKNQKAAELIANGVDPTDLENE